MARNLKHYGDDEDYTWNGELVWLTFGGNSIALSINHDGDLLVETFHVTEEAGEPEGSAVVYLPWSTLR